MSTTFSFQLTRSRGAWRTRFTALALYYTNFNSHAHVERDMTFHFPPFEEVKISTHTLTWSVTQRLCLTAVSVWISTHTLTWSVTVVISQREITIHISTHTLTWSVTEKVILFIFFLEISTHTLTWSVTLILHQPIEAYSHFNSHAHVERDALRGGGGGRCAFQLTRSRGAWRADHSAMLQSLHFNSHAHVERDIILRIKYAELFTFQLTRSRGAWLGILLYW